MRFRIGEKEEFGRKNLLLMQSERLSRAEVVVVAVIHSAKGRQFGLILTLGSKLGMQMERFQRWSDKTGGQEGEGEEGFLKLQGLP